MFDDDDDAPALRPGAEETEWVTIRGSDLPDPISAPWLRRVSVLDVLGNIDSADFADDDPEELRGADADEIASGLVMLAEGGLIDVRKPVRLAAKLLLEHFGEGNFHHDDLSFDIGLRKRDGRWQLSRIDQQAKRDNLLMELASKSPWSGMGQWAAAKDIREKSDRYFADVWPTNKTPPASEPKLTFWQIGKIGLTDQMPSKQTLAGMIGECRVE